MRTFYNIADLSLPVMAEHLGAEWNQGVIIRHQGFPHFHWLQTQSGMGAFWVHQVCHIGMNLWVNGRGKYVLRHSRGN